MKFTRKSFNLESINIVNIQDKDLWNNKYIVTFAISNAINPKFLVYANHEQDALSIISEYADNEELNLFIDYYELNDIVGDKEEIERYYQADNGLYTDLDCVYMEKIN